MPEMRASDVPGSWRFFVYAGALCGCSNIYHCCWLPRWLRCLSIAYQIIMLSIYIIIIGVALSDAGPNRSFGMAFNRYMELLFHIIMALSNIIILWQTCCASSGSLLLQTRKTLQTGNPCVVEHQPWPNAITLIICLLVIIWALILIGINTWLVIDKHNFIATYIFPVLKGHATLELMFGLFVISMASTMLFPCCYMLLCFVVIVDITVLFRTVRKEMDVVFSGLIVDDAAVERCLQRIRGICELVDAANGTFGIPLAIYLMWIIPTIINVGLQLFIGQELSLIIFQLMSVYAVVIFVLILVPPAVMTAQVNPHW